MISVANKFYTVFFYQQKTVLISNNLCRFTNSTAKMSIFQKVTHVIFDLDGLILDTEPIYFQMFTDIAAKYKKIYSKEVSEKLMGTTEQNSARIMVEGLSLPITAEQFLEEQQQLKSRLSSGKLTPGSECLIHHLHKHGVPIAIATSSGMESVQLKSTNHKELFSLFHHIVAASSDPEVKRGKPNPDVFLVCASRFPDKPESQMCLVLEDAPNGVQAAIAAGMQVVMVPDANLSESKRKGATQVIASLQEFKPEQYGLPPF